MTQTRRTAGRLSLLVAMVEPQYLNALHAPFVRYAANGFYVLAKSVGWNVVYNGSEQPPCSLKIPRDLVSGCTR